MVQRWKLHEAYRRETRERGIRCPDCDVVGAWDGAVSAVVCEKCGQLISRSFTPRGSQCRVWSNPYAGGVKIREVGQRADGTMRATVADVYRCNKAWQCPECAAVQTANDRDTLHSCNMRWRGFERDADGKWRPRAGNGRSDKRTGVGRTGRRSLRRQYTYLLTLTVPHHRGQPLQPMRRAVTAAYKRCEQGKAYGAMKKRFDVCWSVRRLEVTHSYAHSWHPHIHAVFGTGRKLRADEIESIREWYFVRWARAVEAAGYKRPSKEFGVDLIEADKGGRYLSKMGLELGGDSEKLARCSRCNGYRGSAWDGEKRCCVECGGELNRTTWQILTDLTEHPTERDRRLWRTYVSDIRGARRLTWSRDKILATISIKEDGTTERGAACDVAPATIRETYAEHVRVPEKARCKCGGLMRDCERCGGTGRYTRYRLVKRKRQERMNLNEKPRELSIPEEVWRLVYSRDPAGLADLVEAFERGDRHTIDAMLGRWAPAAALPPVTFAPGDERPTEDELLWLAGGNTEVLPLGQLTKTACQI